MDMRRDDNDPYMSQHKYSVSLGIGRSQDGDENDSTPLPNPSASTSGTAVSPTSIDTTTRNSPPDLYERTAAILSAKADTITTETFHLAPKQVEQVSEPPAWEHHPSANACSPILSDVPDHDHRSSRYSASTFPAAIKILVSNNVAGSIIGRSGQTISDLQAQSSTRIKLSQSGDYYPGTQDRVCLVQGHTENIKRAAEMLLTRLYELQQQQHYHHLTWPRQHPERAMMQHHDASYGGINIDPTTHTLIPAFSFVVQVLVPTPCCGMIIGKGGTNVKHMVDSSGVYSVNLSPKEGGGIDFLQEAMYPPQPQGFAGTRQLSKTAERVVSIAGSDLKSCIKCLFIILDGMAAHPDISRYANMTTSYLRTLPTNALDAVAGAQGMPAPCGPVPGISPLHEGGGVFHGAIHQSHDNLVVLNNQFQDQQEMSPTSPLKFSHMPQNTLSYNSMPGLLVPHSPQASGLYQQHSPARTPLQAEHNAIFYGSHSGYGAARTISGSMSAPDLLAMQMHESLRVSEPPSAQIDHSFPFPLQIPQPTHQPPGFQAHVAVPDSLIGSILGRGGQTLNEMQFLSGTRIRISQRGEYLPGTRNRVVTIRGPTAQGVATVQYLISKRMDVLPPGSLYLPVPPDNIDLHGMGSNMAATATATMPTSFYSLQQVPICSAAESTEALHDHPP